MHVYKMESYCLKCKKNTENIDPKIWSTSNGGVLEFIKNQEVKRLLSKLGIKIPLSKVPILGDILF